MKIVRTDRENCPICINRQGGGGGGEWSVLGRGRGHDVTCNSSHVSRVTRWRRRDVTSSFVAPSEGSQHQTTWCGRGHMERDHYDYTLFSRSTSFPNITSDYLKQLDMYLLLYFNPRSTKISKYIISMKLKFGFSLWLLLMDRIVTC